MFKVVVIEDEDLIRKGLIYTYNWIHNDCVVVGEASNGVEGLKLINQLEPDIVITDIKMPLLDGLEMISNVHNRTFEVIIITGHAEFEYARKAISFGVNNYLLKPVNHKQLNTILKDLTKQISNHAKVESIQSKIKSLDELEVIDVAFYCNDSNYNSDYTLQAINYITTNYSYKITAEEVADYLRISKTQFGKLFKDDTKMTFNDFLNKYRIQMSLKLMFKSDLRIYEIAEKVGYSEYKYFSRVFKKYLNHTPTEFLSLDTFIK